MRVKWFFSVLAVAAIVAWGVLLRELRADDSSVVIEHADSDKIVSTETMIGTSFEAGADSSEPRVKPGKKDETATAEATPDCIDPNAASEQSLMKISGVGPVLAERIRKYRENEGMFESVDQLMEIKGIGPKTIEKIRKYICFH